MRAMVLVRPRTPLEARELPKPHPGPSQVLIRVKTCGVCRTDLHIVDGELPDGKLPLVLGHEIVGTVERVGASVSSVGVGDTVGVPWLGETCNRCSYCRSGRENLCGEAKFTGYDIDGGYAEYTLADQDYCFLLPPGAAGPEAAPLLCAGLIGFRAFHMAGAADRLGLYGFGAAAHILTQVAGNKGCRVYAFTRPGDFAAQRFARSLGAVWAGDSSVCPPEELDAAVIFAPVGALVPLALRSVSRGGVVVCAGIHMSAIPSFPYRDLWGERAIKSVANLTRKDGQQFFRLLRDVEIRTHVQLFSLEQANEALKALRTGKITGAAVLQVAIQ